MISKVSWKTGLSLHLVRCTPVANQALTCDNLSRVKIVFSSVKPVVVKEDVVFLCSFVLNFSLFYVHLFSGECAFLARTNHLMRNPKIKKAPQFSYGAFVFFVLLLITIFRGYLPLHCRYCYHVN